MGDVEHADYFPITAASEKSVYSALLVLRSAIAHDVEHSAHSLKSRMCYTADEKLDLQMKPCYCGTICNEFHHCCIVLHFT